VIKHIWRGQICTRRCPFCDVAHGKPKPLDVNEPQHLAQTIEKMQLKYVVITSSCDRKSDSTSNICCLVSPTPNIMPDLVVTLGCCCLKDFNNFNE
jgi:hypothetical protein